MDLLTHRERKVAIITGATSGIGSWLAAHLHKRGYRVAVVGRREKEGQAVVSELDASGDSAIFVACDVSSYEAQCNLFQTVWKKWLRLDLVIANAGCVDRDSKFNFARREAPIDDLPPQPDTTCTEVDFKGVVYGTTLATHFMRHNPGGKGGKIIVTGSMIGIYPCPTFPEYCASKAAVHQWVKTVGPVTLKKDNISINCVMPGGIETPAMPGFSEAFLPHQMTLRSTLFAAYDRFIDDVENTISGQTIEAAHDKIYEWGLPGYKSGAFAKRTEKVYEPWFSLVHGENSELPGALSGPPAKGPKIIAVTGATGSQGGGVANVMKNVEGWKVRAITRNTNSDAAKKLTSEGVEVVQANFDDEESLVKAFEGVSAAFAVTNWWEHLFSGKSQEEAGVLEEEQGMKLARAAARTDTLEHYIWSTTPSAKRMFRGKLLTPHMDYKANIDARIKSELPNLAAMTTYLYFGYYPQNMAYFPLIKPILHPANGQYIQTMPSKPDAKVLNSGDMTINPGIWVRQVLATGEKAFGKYANVALEKMTFQEMMDVWSEVTGKKGVYMETTIDAWTKLWGPAGNELGLQFKFGEMCDPWEETDEFISPEELGIDKNEVVGFRGTIEGLKHMF
ncbi:NAD(P)-binding protein [Sporormia fimetaria CBS 119925]|uniref:NAD(P)-binding protein n=1 Tax=Sporormia fimetaria CBS 119925 TaxID=1340428 RepID=A0A6A6VLF8_9PLEO|nr:NAD(P)-binding protein [Sporormia fimetaria CBS 119925]